MAGVTRTNEAIPRYDVLKRDCGGLLWIEAMDDLESAWLRVQELSSATYGEYLVFDQNTGQTVGQARHGPRHEIRIGTDELLACRRENVLHFTGVFTRSPRYAAHPKS